VRTAFGLSLLLVAGSLSSPARAAAPGVPAGPVSLGAAAAFSVLAGPSITNTGAETVLALDLGVDGTLAGFPPGTVNGTTHVGDASVETAQEDRQSAYDSVVAQTGGTAFAGDQAGKTYTPGLYSTAAAITNTGTITLDAAGDPSARFVFQIGAALSSAAGTKVVLANGALANNVYWQVVGAVSLGADVTWVGTVLGAGAVSFGEGASLKGRILTPSTVALANSPVTQPIDDLVAPVVAIDGGDTRSTNDTTPSISGTTDEPGSPLVTVTIGTQVLTTRATAGSWTMSAEALTPGSHHVLASVSDPSGNTGTADQVLTVDVTAPTVSITGGSSAATSDTTPTISGTTDEPGAPAVTVSVEGQTLTTTSVDGTWAVEAGALSETSHSVVASVGDAAGNRGSDSQVLTVDLTVPVLTIDGGPRRYTSDTSPWTYGTTAEQAGTIVRVAVGDQTLTASVKPGGAWGVSAQELPSGTYTVLASITDAAQNTGTVTQVLQVGPVVTAPAVTIDGGASRDTNDTTPEISGTTGEPGTATVTVTVGGESLAATSDGGVWSVEVVTPLTEGSSTVTASVTVGDVTRTASQTLSVDVTAPTLTIDGGTTRSTTDTTPWIRGTTVEPPGSVVRIDVGAQSLVATANSDRTWGVSADTLAEGAYVVVASMVDSAGNTGSARQSLTIAPQASTTPQIPPTAPPVAPVAPPVAPPNPSYRPDAAVRAGKGTFVGQRSYDPTRQRATVISKKRTRTARFEVRLTNRGDVDDSFRLRATRTSTRLAVRYLLGGKDVTAAVLKGSYRTTSLRSGESLTLAVEVTQLQSAGRGTRWTSKIRVQSVHNPQKVDSVATVVR
jgi:hypothetical protein